MNGEVFKETLYLSKAQLLKLRVKALRHGLWFKVLSRIDRAIVDIAIRINLNIRSSKLVKSILSIINKLEQAVENKFAYAITNVGAQLAIQLSLLAEKWGNKTAYKWVEDERFARYLAIMKYNGYPST